MEFSMFYITFPTKAEAERITSYLVENRLAACANLFPIQSVYWWNGTVNRGEEWVGIVKTVTGQVDRLTETVTRLHPYEVPCIVRLPAIADPLFGAWLAAETG